MGFLPGHAKYGGRKKGMPSRAKMRVEEVKESFIAMRCNPIKEMIRVARSKVAVPDWKIKALTELLKYYAPKLTTQHVTHTVRNDIHAEQLQHLAMTDDAAFAAMEMLSLKMS
jgi:hypothetical protein